VVLRGTVEVGFQNILALSFSVNSTGIWTQGLMPPRPPLLNKDLFALVIF
jgi:hypothetical protein